MHQSDNAPRNSYPHGRGYGHDYMRGGEVFGGYGYAEREEYAKRRGESTPTSSKDSGEDPVGER